MQSNAKPEVSEGSGGWGQKEDTSDEEPAAASKKEKRVKGNEQGGLRPLRDRRIWNSATASGVPSHWRTS